MKKILSLALIEITLYIVALMISNEYAFKYSDLVSPTFFCLNYLAIGSMMFALYYFTIKRVKRLHFFVDTCN